VLYEESLTQALRIDAKDVLHPSLEGLARVAAAQENMVWATRLWGAAERLRQSLNFPLLPLYRTGYEQAVTAARYQLGAQMFEVAWAEGQSMTLEEVLVAREDGTKTRPIPTPSPTQFIQKFPISPLGLTPREVEVLRLVAQGLTDSQVATQLVISSRTVNWHLSSIYDKLGVSSRAGATRLAVEHGLV
jgi:DNA-binding CsgD family transcriptional regulator